MNQFQFVLTRLLYVKDEVKISLLMSILQKKKEDSLFWAYELYYSGFEEEVFEFIWTIYFDFFATLNPLFELYISKKEKEWIQCCKEEKSDIIIGLLIENLLIRSFNTDIFMLSRQNNNNNNNNNEIMKDKMNEKMVMEWITSNNYQEIAQYIFSPRQNIKETESMIRQVFKKINDQFKIKKLQLFKNQDIMKKQLLSRILGYYSQSNQTKKKQFYMMIDESKIEPFKLTQVCSIKPYRILTQCCTKGTNDHGYLSLFASTLSRNQLQDIKSVYHNDWLYYASFSPLWLHRIQQYNGVQNEETKQIVFPNEEQEEEFYNHWNYEPDEQSLELKQKTIPEIKINDFELSSCLYETFQQNYNENGLI